MTETKFKVGDQVKIINYVHLAFIDGVNKDISSNDLGRTAIIIEAHKTQGVDTYSLFGDISKKSWYDNGQLELVYRPEYK